MTQITKAWVTLILFKLFRFQIFAFSNQSTSDCIFKSKRFHDRPHRFCVNGGENITILAL